MQKLNSLLSSTDINYAQTHRHTQVKMVVTKLTWEGCEPASEWIKRIDLNAVKETFLEYGFFVSIKIYKKIVII